MDVMLVRVHIFSFSVWDSLWYLRSDWNEIGSNLIYSIKTVTLLKLGMTGLCMDVLDVHLNWVPIVLVFVCDQINCIAFNCIVWNMWILFRSHQSLVDIKCLLQPSTNEHKFSLTFLADCLYFLGKRTELQLHITIGLPTKITPFEIKDSEKFNNFLIDVRPYISRLNVIFPRFTYLL